MKLWEKGYQVNEKIERFVVGEDYLLDRELVFFDCIGTISHIRGLLDIGILTQDEFKRIKAGLCEIIELDKRSEFVIEESDEDCHTKIENHLVRKVGRCAEKIHTGRSRNDQVLTALRLYAKDRLLSLQEKTLSLSEEFLCFAERFESVPMPGRTHLQKAMLSSVGLWAGAYSESLADDARLLYAVYDLCDQSPLGAGASYGVPLCLDRELTARLLGFSKVQKNSLYVNNSRGKFEAFILFALLGVVLDISKFAEDLIIFMLPEFSYFSLPDDFFFGSSSMPQKKNPSFLEMMRARSNSFISHIFQTVSIINSLPSGYNQDLQETKGPLLSGFRLVQSMIEITRLVVENLSVNEDALKKGISSEIFAYDAAIELVKEGVPFREAYRRVAKELDRLNLIDLREAMERRSHIGAPGNLELSKLKTEIKERRGMVKGMREAFNERIEELIKQDL
jgi:argininosuccinate lyase